MTYVLLATMSIGSVAGAIVAAQDKDLRSARNQVSQSLALQTFNRFYMQLSGGRADQIHVEMRVLKDEMGPGLGQALWLQSGPFSMVCVDVDADPTSTPDRRGLQAVLNSKEGARDVLGVNNTIDNPHQLYLGPGVTCVKLDRGSEDTHSIEVNVFNSQRSDIHVNTKPIATTGPVVLSAADTLPVMTLGSTSLSSNTLGIS